MMMTRKTMPLPHHPHSVSGALLGHILEVGSGYDLASVAPWRAGKRAGIGTQRCLLSKRKSNIMQEADGGGQRSEDRRRVQAV